MASLSFWVRDYELIRHAFRGDSGSEKTAAVAITMAIARILPRLVVSRTRTLEGITNRSGSGPAICSARPVMSEIRGGEQSLKRNGRTGTVGSWVERLFHKWHIVRLAKITENAKLSQDGGLRRIFCGPGWHSPFSRG